MTDQTARQAKQARIAELAKTAKLFPTQPEAIAWVIDHRLPEMDAKAIFLANDIEPEGQWTTIEALQKAEKSAHARELDAAIARRATEEGGTIRKRDLMQEPETKKPKWDLAKALDAAEAERAKKVLKAVEGKIFSEETQSEDESEDVDEPEAAADADAANAANAGTVVPSNALVAAEPLQGELILPWAAAAAEMVAALNQKHSVIGNYGSKCVVLSWERWNINPDVLVPTFQSFEDFKKRYMNRYAERQTDEGTKRVAVGKFWLGNPKRTTYEGVVFEPGEPVLMSGNRLNLWRGFAVEPKAGCWSRQRDHLYEVIADGDTRAGQYIERWIAWMFQNPGLPAEVALALRGLEGVGKGLLARALLRIFGHCGLPISDPKHLVGAFSGHLQHCVFLFVDEAYWAGDVKGEGRLKALLTEKTITIEPKYVQPFQVRNLLHVLIASNNGWVVPAGPDARRYAVFDVSERRLRDFGYFEKLAAEQDNGGAEAMLYDLLRLPLAGWHPKQIYETAALTDQKQRSLRGVDAAIDGWLQEGILPNYSRLWLAYPNRATSDDLLRAVREFDRHTNKEQIAGELKKLFNVKTGNTDGNRGWIFPPLHVCREIWERKHGGRWRWHLDTRDWLDRAAQIQLSDLFGSGGSGRGA